MSASSFRKQKMFSSFKITLVLVALLGFQLCAKCNPLNNDEENTTTENNTEPGNDTAPEDLYVIKSVVYEIGVLTDAANDTDNSTESQEQVDIFHPGLNDGSSIDLSSLRQPIQTNVSSITNTEIVPGASLAAALQNYNSNGLLLPGIQVTVIQNISTSNPEHGEEIIDNLPKLLGLKPYRRDSSEEDSSQDSDSKSDERERG